MTRDPGPASLVRCCLVWLGGSAALLGGALLLLPGLAASPVLADPLAAQPFDRVLVTTCEVALLLAGGWMWAVTTVVATDAARGRARARRGVPAGLRRLLLVACGAAVVGGLTAPSYAASAVAGDGRGTDASAISGLPLPDRASTALHISLLVRRQSEAAAPPDGLLPRRVVVHPGDSLWSIAADTLPSGSRDAEIAARWQQIYRANRAVIGADPDLIHPSQSLRLPRP